MIYLPPLDSCLNKHHLSGRIVFFGKQGPPVLLDPLNIESFTKGSTSYDPSCKMRDKTLMFILLTHLLTDTAQHSLPWVPRTELSLKSVLGSQIRMSSAAAGVGEGRKTGLDLHSKECGAGVWSLVHGPVTSYEVSAGYPPFTVSS